MLPPLIPVCFLQLVQGQSSELDLCLVTTYLYESASLSTSPSSSLGKEHVGEAVLRDTEGCGRCFVLL